MSFLPQISVVKPKPLPLFKFFPRIPDRYPASYNSPSLILPILKKLDPMLFCGSAWWFMSLLGLN